MTIELYYHVLSPPCRAVLVVLSILKTPHVLKTVDLLNKEQYRPEILELNPQHTIPILKDNGTVIVDSHVINSYLVEKYGSESDKQLYPNETEARTDVEHKLHYDTGILFPALQGVKTAYRVQEITGVTEKIVNQFESIYTTLQAFLKNSKYIAGSHYTIADISIYISLSVMREIWAFTESTFPLLSAYMKRCETDIPYLKNINDPGIVEWKKMMDGFKFSL